MYRVSTIPIDDGSIGTVSSLSSFLPPLSSLTSLLLFVLIFLPLLHFLSFPCTLFFCLSSLCACFPSCAPSISHSVCLSLHFLLSPLSLFQGYLEDTALFYGAYTNGTVSQGYQMAEAYLSVAIIFYLVSLFLIVYR